MIISIYSGPEMHLNNWVTFRKCWNVSALDAKPNQSQIILELLPEITVFAIVRNLVSMWLLVAVWCYFSQVSCRVTISIFHHSNYEHVPLTFDNQNITILSVLSSNSVGQYIFLPPLYGCKIQDKILNSQFSNMKIRLAMMYNDIWVSC